MRLLALFACMGIVFAVTSGCTPQVPKAPPLAAVKGAVTLDGKPMQSGEIEFEVIAQPSVSLKIEGGVFSGEVFTGKNNVRLHMYKPGPPSSTDPEKKPTKMEALPARFNANSTFSADVPEGGLNDLKYDITSK